MDIWLKSAKPSALLKDPLPKGSKVPKGPASSTNRGRVTGHSRNTPPGAGDVLPLAGQRPSAQDIPGGHICLPALCHWMRSLNMASLPPTHSGSWLVWLGQKPLAMTAASGRATGTVSPICTSPSTARSQSAARLGQGQRCRSAGPTVHTRYVGRLSAGVESCRAFSFGGTTFPHNPHTHL